MSKPRPLQGETTTLDHLMGGKLLIRQPVEGHRGGTDTMLLAAAAPPTQGVLVDLGAGVGTAGLAVARRGGCGQAVLAEIQPHLAALASENITANALSERVRVVCADALTPAGRRAGGLANGMADVVIANPPYLTPRQTRTSPEPTRALAHSLGEAGIESWLRAAAALLLPGGRLALIHRTDALRDILNVASGRFGGIQIIPVYPREGEPSRRIILRAVKGSRAPLTIAPPLLVHGEGGGFTERAAALHTGDELL
jgi:tRNA1(Val) A37 N6-methylase TrmN6